MKQVTEGFISYNFNFLIFAAVKIQNDLIILK